MKNFNFLLLLLVVFIGIICAQEGGGDKGGVQQGDKDKQQQDKDKQQQQDKDKQQEQDKDKKQEQDKDKQQQDKDKQQDQDKDKKQEDKDKQGDKKDDNKDKNNDNKDGDKDKEKPDMSKVSYSKKYVELRLKSPEALQDLKLLLSMQDNIDFQWEWVNKLYPKSANDIKFTLVNEETASRPSFEIGKAGVMASNFKWVPKSYNEKDNIKEELKPGAYKLFIHDAKKAYNDQIKPTQGEFLYSTQVILYEQHLNPDTKYLLDSSSPHSITSISWGTGSFAAISALSLAHYLL